MRQGGLILAAGRVRSKKKTQNHGHFFYGGAYQKGNKKRKHIFLAFSTSVALLAIIFFTLFHGEVLSAAPQPRALQLDLRNECNQKVLSRAIHRIFQLA